MKFKSTLIATVVLPLSGFSAVSLAEPDCTPWQYCFDTPTVAQQDQTLGQKFAQDNNLTDFAKAQKQAEAKEAELKSLAEKDDDK